MLSNTAIAYSSFLTSALSSAIITSVFMRDRITEGSDPTRKQSKIEQISPKPFVIVFL